MYLDMYEQSLAKLVGGVMATGPHSRLDAEVEPCSTCEAKRKEVNGDEREQHQDRDGRMQLTTHRKS